MQNGNLQKSLLAGPIVLALLVMSVGLSAPEQAGGEMITTTPAAGVTLFEDDFATYSGRWLLTENAKVTVTYDEEALHLRVVSPGVYVWSVPDFDTPLRNYYLDVTATIRQGSPDSVFGFVIDYQDDEHFYAVVTTAQGDWQVLRRHDGEWLDLTPADAEPVERAADDHPLSLRAEVIDGTFTFYVDDQRAVSVMPDESLSGGVFGVIARAGRGYVDVSFDDFKVTAEN